MCSSCISLSCHDPVQLACRKPHRATPNNDEFLALLVSVCSPCWMFRNSLCYIIMLHTLSCLHCLTDWEGVLQELSCSISLHTHGRDCLTPSISYIIPYPICSGMVHMHTHSCTQCIYMFLSSLTGTFYIIHVHVHVGVSSPAGRVLLWEWAEATDKDSQWATPPRAPGW